MVRSWWIKMVLYLEGPFKFVNDTSPLKKRKSGNIVAKCNTRIFLPSKRWSVHVVGIEWRISWKGKPYQIIHVLRSIEERRKRTDQLEGRIEHTFPWSYSGSKVPMDKCISIPSKVTWARLCWNLSFSSSDPIVLYLFPYLIHSRLQDEGYRLHWKCPFDSIVPLKGTKREGYVKEKKRKQSK